MMSREKAVVSVVGSIKNTIRPSWVAALSALLVWNEVVACSLDSSLSGRISITPERTGSSFVYKGSECVFALSTHEKVAVNRNVISRSGNCDAMEEIAAVSGLFSKIKEEGLLPVSGTLQWGELNNPEVTAQLVKEALRRGENLDSEAFLKHLQATDWFKRLRDELLEAHGIVIWASSVEHVRMARLGDLNLDGLEGVTADKAAAMEVPVSAMIWFRFHQESGMRSPTIE